MTDFSLGRFRDGNSATFLGLVIGDAVTRVSDLGLGLPGDIMLLDLLQQWDVSLERLREAVEAGRANGGYSLADLHADAPHPNPPQIFCTGANYRGHVIEMVQAIGVKPDTDGMNAEELKAYAHDYVARQEAESSPFVFIKPVSSITGPFDPIILPASSQKVDWELELGVVIGRRTFDVARGDALSHVAGYMVTNDVTARDKVFRSEPGVIGPDWVSGKGYPSFLPTGPLFRPACFVENPQDMAMELSVNGTVMQQESTSDMIFDIDRQISFISHNAEMLAGDILCTGSPAGNGMPRGIFLKPGDIVEAGIEGLGRMRNECQPQ